MNLYVGNLNFNLTEDELRQVFEEYGEVSSVKIITDKFSGRSKGFGFVEFEKEEDSNKAIEELNGMDVGGRNIKVNVATKKRDKDKKYKKRYDDEY